MTNLTTDTYGPPGSTSPQNVVLVNDATQGYYNSAVARLLDGTDAFFPANDPPLAPSVKFYEHTEFGGQSITFTGDVSCLSISPAPVRAALGTT